MPGKEIIPQNVSKLIGYEEYLSCLTDKELFQQFQKWTKSCSIDDPDLFSQNEKTIDRNILIQNFLKKFITVTFLTKCLESLSEREREFFLNGVKEGGIFAVENNPVFKSSYYKNLKNQNFIFSFKKNNLDYMSIPLELFFVTSALFNIRTPFLLKFVLYNNYTANLLKHIAHKNNITLYQNHKLSVASKVYHQFTTNIEQKMDALSEKEKIVLYWFFTSEKFLSDQEFAIRASDGKERYHGSWGYYENPLNQYLRSPSSQHWNQLNEYEQILTQLVYKGVIAVCEGSFYQSYDYFITEIFWPGISEIFFQEIDAQRLKLEKKLYVKAPAKMITYEACIVDDLVKVQIAVFCGLLEVTNKQAFKKKSLSNLQKILNIDPNYLEILLNLLLPFIQIASTNQCYQKEINFDGLTIIRDFFKADPFFQKIVPVLFSISDWCDVQIFVKYILNTRECYGFQKSFQENEIIKIIQKFCYSGIIKLSEDLSKLKPTAFLTQILGKSKPKGIPLIKAKDKPLIVQPNLELLIPYHIEFDLLKKIAQFSEVSVIDKMIHFNLTKNSLIKAMDSGWTLKKLNDFLTSLSTTGIPTVVQKFLDTIGKKQGEAIVYSCTTLVKCSDFLLREKILAIKQLRAFIPEGQEEYVAVKDKDAYDVVQILKKKGIMAISNMDQESTDTPSTLLEKLQFYRKKKTRVCLTISYADDETDVRNALITKIENKTVHFRYRPTDVNEIYDYKNWVSLKQIVNVQEEKNNGL